jgi:hypothetical protein
MEIRNLLFFCCPLKNQATIFNLDKIDYYLDKFNGKKIIYFALDNNTYSIEDLKGIVSEKILNTCEIYFVKNNPVIRETAWFIEMLEKVESLDEKEYTFYCHSKGTSNFGTNREKPSFIWAEKMYRDNLDNLDLVNQKFQEKYTSCVGTLKIPFNYGPITSEWHYSGTFFWFKNSKLFSLDYWKDINLSRYGTESYLGSKFKNRLAKSVYKELNKKNCDLYNLEHWKQIL